MLRLSPATAVVLLLSLLGSAAAEQPRLQPDFTFKRVRPPQPGQKGPRITVQITPQAPTASEAPVDGAAPVVPSGSDWFWSQIAPDLEVKGASRLQAALRLMRSAPQAKSVQAPRLQALQEITRRHGRDLLRETVGTRVSPALALAVMVVESGGNPSASSGAGAQGLMQLMPDTATRFGVTDPLDPGQSIKGGVAYLDWLIGHFDGDMILALAGYNAGEGAVRRAAGVPGFPETRAYIPKVLAAWQVASGLCKTPPVLLSDGCVFITN